MSVLDWDFMLDSMLTLSASLSIINHNPPSLKSLTTQVFVISKDAASYSFSDSNTPFARALISIWGRLLLDKTCRIYYLMMPPLLQLWHVLHDDPKIPLGFMCHFRWTPQDLYRSKGKHQCDQWWIGYCCNQQKCSCQVIARSLFRGNAIHHSWHDWEEPTMYAATTARFLFAALITQC